MTSKILHSDAYLPAHFYKLMDQTSIYILVTKYSVFRVILSTVTHERKCVFCHVHHKSTIKYLSGYLGNCVAGEYVDPDDLQACLKCPLDTYQENPDPVFNVDNCTDCDSGFGTMVEGANSSAMCMSE